MMPGAAYLSWRASPHFLIETESMKIALRMYLPESFSAWSYSIHTWFARSL